MTHAQAIRPSAVAGTFYPAEAEALSREISRLMVPNNGTSLTRPKALIVPHAGYVYSGAVAASAYALLAPLADTIRRVVLFGPAHRVAVRGMAVPSVEAFATPLGLVRIDTLGCREAARLPFVEMSDLPHAPEHALEVQLPFLQSTLGSFELLPIVVGSATPEQVATVMDIFWGGAETLIVVSSDLSHYHPYAQARALDEESVAAIATLTGLSRHEQACGAIPVNGLVIAARRHGLEAHVLDVRNSGDFGGDRARVVGYAALAFCPAPPASTSDAAGKALLVLARNAIATELGLPTREEMENPVLREPGACFVRLTQDGQLRGCIGSLQAWRPLIEDVRANARAAAFRDPRFLPLTPDELPQTRIEVSLLTPPEPLSFRSENELLDLLHPLSDGLILEWHGQRATFLPQVWEQLPKPRQFLAHLKQKAGLAADFWADDVRVLRYGVQKWKERSPSS